jgi:uroporphyrinogen-III synthase
MTKGSHNAAMATRAHPSHHWTLLSLRPQGGHATLRAAAARHGGHLLALSPWALRRLDDADARSSLEAALTASATIFTSPEAARAAAVLAPQPLRHAALAIAVGSGTARALRRAGVGEVAAPRRMDSEGVLALPALQAASGTVGLVTAPGGRGHLVEALQQRGLTLRRADVYRREPIALRREAVERLASDIDRCALALSSAEALQQVLAQLPPALALALRQRPVAAASERLVALALAQGFTQVAQAPGPLPAQLAATAAATMTPRPPH